MQLTDDVKRQIDAMPYVELLSRWRFSPSGTELFEGESAEYFAARMKMLRAQPGGDAMHVAASKAIG